MNKFSKLIATTITTTVLSLSATQVLATGTHSSGHGDDDQPNIGVAGKLADVSRTIKINMLDNYYEPENVSVKEGETIKFVVTNNGEFVHEFSVGTSEMHTGHQEEMAMMVEHGILEADKINHDMMKMDMGNGKTMEHNDPNSILLEPGQSGEVIWKFGEKISLEFACNIPGHYDSGMAGMFQFSTDLASNN